MDPVAITHTPVELAESGRAIISLRDIEKFFQHGLQRTYVLRRISLDFTPGEFVSIMGPSGAGKSHAAPHPGHARRRRGPASTCCTASRIHALGKRERAELQKKHIGFVFQSYHLLDHLTVYENLDMPLSYRDIKKKERDSMVCDMLDRFQIVGKKDLYPSQLSGGQQQLVAVARALISKPTHHPRRRADRQPALGAGPRDHGAVHSS